MKILWMTWKDRKHPLAGGAETVNEEIAKRLAKDGHKVVFLVAGFPGCNKEEEIDGYTVIRLGNRYTVYLEAYRYYMKEVKGWPDLVIDEMNTIPFFANLYVKEKRIMFVHQLCREIWFYQMFFPLSLIGYLLEPLYLQLIKGEKVITISESTKKDLMRYGFKEENVSIISEGIEMESVAELGEKYPEPTILSLGSLRPMKRTMEIVKAFEAAKVLIPELKLVLAGGVDSRYGSKVLEYIQKSPYSQDIRYYGIVTGEKKRELMQKSHLICVTSVKEGWGLIVTEANSQGTPAIVYDVDGLRDSVRDEETGLVCERNDCGNMVEKMVELLQDKEKYERLRGNAWKWSKEITFERSYREFLLITKI
jgi:glycosyltransferase involved in cell wall biosynthesis